MKSGSLKRINITLPEDTFRLLERVAPSGDRSRLIREAIHAYVESGGRKRLRAELKEGATARASRDRALAAEWFAADQQAWTGQKR